MDIDELGELYWQYQQFLSDISRMMTGQGLAPSLRGCFEVQTTPMSLAEFHAMVTRVSEDPERMAQMRELLANGGFRVKRPEVRLKLEGIIDNSLSVD